MIQKLGCRVSPGWVFREAFLNELDGFWRQRVLDASEFWDVRDDGSVDVLLCLTVEGWAARQQNVSDDSD